jgi:aryl-alcohol dehydrogenase-like predicted oxidoreductase
VFAYSPLGKELLTGKCVHLISCLFLGKGRTFLRNVSQTNPDDFEEDDMRRIILRYSKENFPNVLKVVEEVKQIGVKHSASAGQVTLAWLLAQGPDVIPIPDTRNVEV